jgi:hypothetical protein
MVFFANVVDYDKQIVDAASSRGLLEGHRSLSFGDQLLQSWLAQVLRGQADELVPKIRH